MADRMDKKKTFLVAAYACEPNEGSEPGVGWNWSIELAKRNRVIVITGRIIAARLRANIRERNIRIFHSSTVMFRNS